LWKNGGCLAVQPLNDLPAGLLTWIQPNDAPSRLKFPSRQWLSASPVLLTALGTWRNCTAFPILHSAQAEQHPEILARKLGRCRC